MPGSVASGTPCTIHTDMYLLIEKCPLIKLEMALPCIQMIIQKFLTAPVTILYYAWRNRDNTVDILEWHPNHKSPPPQSSSTSGNWRNGGKKKNTKIFQSVSVWGPSTMSKSQKYYGVIHWLMVIKNQHQVIHDWWDLTFSPCHMNNLTNGSSLFDMQMCTWLHSFIRLVADYITHLASSHPYKFALPEA